MYYKLTILIKNLINKVYIELNKSIPGESPSKADGAAKKISQSMQQYNIINANKIRGSLNPNAKLNELKVREIKLAFKNNTNTKELITFFCKKFNIQKATIYSIKNNQTWTHVTID